jgi:hypothetical protein
MRDSFLADDGEPQLLAAVASARRWPSNGKSPGLQSALE